MKKFIVSILFALSAALLPASGSLAGSSGVELEAANVDIHDKASLQRGAKYFVNYCMGCHSLKFSRYNRIATDFGLTEKQVENNLIFTRTNGNPTKVGGLMENGMSAAYGEEAFGAAPPDLSLVSRSRGDDWVYSFLKTFYLDPSRPMGVNNEVFENTGMPHVLWELQGWQEMEKHDDGKGHVTQELKLVEPGTMPAAEYDQVVYDITNFLSYVGEPAKLHRKTIGIWVMLFLGIFAVIAYFLKKEYWKDVH